MNKWFTEISLIFKLEDSCGVGQARAGRLEADYQEGT